MKNNKPNKNSKIEETVKDAMLLRQEQNSEIQENHKIITSKRVWSQQDERKKCNEWVLCTVLHSSATCYIPLYYNTLLPAVNW